MEMRIRFESEIDHYTLTRLQERLIELLDELQISNSIEIQQEGFIDA